MTSEKLAHAVHHRAVNLGRLSRSLRQLKLAKTESDRQHFTVMAKIDRSNAAFWWREIRLERCTTPEARLIELQKQIEELKAAA